MEYGQKVLKYKGRVVFEKMSMPYFKRLPKEFFEDEACFIFVNEGEFSIRSQDQYFTFKKDNAILAKCLNYFFETNEKQCQIGEGVEVIGVLLYPSLVEELFQFDLNTSTHSVDYNLKQFEVDALLLNYKNSINILLDHPELADENLLETKLKEFVLLITKSLNIPSQLDFLAAMFKPSYIPFKEIIHANLYADLSLEQLAKLSHLSLSSFKRKFKEVFDESPKKYITSKKVEKAAQLLKASEDRISDIAYDCGFENSSTFNRVFKSFHQLSPSAYRLSQNDK